MTHKRRGCLQGRPPLAEQERPTHRAVRAAREPAPPQPLRCAPPAGDTVHVMTVVPLNPSELSTGMPLEAYPMTVEPNPDDAEQVARG